jgi:hypothetical protein
MDPLEKIRADLAVTQQNMAIFRHETILHVTISDNELVQFALKKSISDNKAEQI